MCGIVGWLSIRDSRPVDHTVLARMRDAMAHRGPDGRGSWVDPQRRIGLGFRRLAIIDLPDSANQPMTNEDQTVRLVFNGEIYNHQALRRELMARGHRFQTHHSDSEVIVHSYEEWGEKVLDHLDGMFAFAIWDERRQKVFLARDRIGIKPLYFSWIPHAFLFGSEIKALLRHPDLSPQIEPTSVYHYLSFLTAPAPLTMFRGIYKLPAGHCGFVTPEGNLQATRYWDALPGQGPDSQHYQSLPANQRRRFAEDRTRALLDQAIEKRMMSDVPFGVFLSGGVDSTANVALMTKHQGRSVNSFTVGFSDHTALNELAWARKAAKHFKTNHNEVMVDETAMREYLPSLIYSQDEPIADWVCIPLYFLSKLARDSGTVVVQVGEGSDEQFCGYQSYMAYLDMHRRYWQPYSRLMPRFARGIGSLLASSLMSLHDKHDAYLDLIVRAGREREPFWSGATVFPEPRKSLLIDKTRLLPLHTPKAMRNSGLLPPAFEQPDTFEIIRSLFERIDRLAPGSDFLTRMSYSEFKLRLPELLLMRVDKIGMSASIEPRVPFLDQQLVEFTMSLPQEMKVGDGVSKSILKAALRGVVPDEIIDRPKVGFSAPVSDWLRQGFGGAVDSAFRSTRFFDEFPADRTAILNMLSRHREGKADFALYIWAFYNATAWFDSWVDGDAKACVA